MRQTLSKLSICLSLSVTAAFCQTKLSFEVATIKPAPPLDQAKLVAALQSGKMPFGASIGSGRAEYHYVDLRTLITYAYRVRPYQIAGPDWMATTRFDIVAKMPEGSTKNDASEMLRALLEERFALKAHRASVEQPVLALVVGKNGPKLKPSTEMPVAIDENAPLKPGEMKMDGPEGPVRAKIDLATGSSVVDMGLKGKMSYRVDPATKSMKIDFSMVTMSGLADMMTQLMTQIGGPGSRQIIDMTGIKGNYDSSVEISLAEIMALARAAGANIPVSAPEANAVPADPGGGSSIPDAVQSMGLKLESRKATVDQLIVDHVEKTPTEN